MESGRAAGNSFSLPLYHFRILAHFGHKAIIPWLKPRCSFDGVIVLNVEALTLSLRNLLV